MPGEPLMVAYETGSADTRDAGSSKTPATTSVVIATWELSDSGRSVKQRTREPKLLNPCENPQANIYPARQKMTHGFAFCEFDGIWDDAVRVDLR